MNLEPLVGEVDDLTTRCLTFPILNEPVIERENILNQIERWFLNDKVPLVAFDGDEGMGKTMLMAQFCRRHPKHALSLFIGPSGTHASSPEYLRQDLCDQLLWLFEQPEPSPEQCSQNFLQLLLGRLSSEAKRRNQHYFFVVDGFHNISEDEKGITESIIKLLPWGSSQLFHFLISGPEGRIQYPKQNNARQSHISLFTLPETQEFFKGVVGPEEARTIYKDFNGWPSKLTNVRRLLVEADDPVQRLNELPKTDPGLFELEWAGADKVDDVTTLLLAFLAHESGEHTIQDLATMGDASVADTYDKLKTFTFLEKRGLLGQSDEKSDPAIIGQLRIDFVSSSFRQFALQRLHRWKSHVEERRINLLSQDLTTKTGQERVATLVELTGMLDAKKRAHQLLELLRPDSIIEILSGSHSLSLTRQRVQGGIDAAVAEGRDKDMHPLAIQKCVLTELEDAFIGLPEIEAHLALGEYDVALKMARNAILYEDRLHQLATIAQAKHKRKLPIEPEVSDQIKFLCEEVNAVALGERAIDIASALLPTHPDLALSLVERANRTSGENSLDWALARVSVAAIQKESKEAETGAETPEALRAKIQDPAAQRFTQMAGLLYSSGQYSASEIVAQVNTLEKAGDQLFILRQWALSNAQQPDAALVVERGIEILGGARDYIPSSRDLRHLAAPLPYLKAEDGHHLLPLLRGLHETMLHRAVTEDDVVLRLLMAETAWKWDEEDADERFNEIFIDVMSLADLGIRSSCLARLLATLSIADPEKHLENSHGIHSWAESELALAVEQLLAQTAEQFLAFRGVLRALAWTHASLVFEWIELLNLGERRDRAYGEFVQAAIRAPLDQIDFNSIEKALQRCSEYYYRSQAILAGAEILNRKVENASRTMGQTAGDTTWEPAKVIGFLSWAGKIEEVDLRCRALCLAVVTVAQCNIPGSNNYDSLIQCWLSQLQNDWSSIESAWERTEIGFDIVSTLGELEKVPVIHNAAREFLARVEAERETLPISHERPGHAYFYCLSLAIRAHAGLTVGNNATTTERDRLVDAIESLPSVQRQLTLWTEWALRTYRNTEFFTWACTKGVLPLLQNIKKADVKDNIERAVIRSAPTLFLYHQNTALDELRALSADSRDEACEAICRFLIDKKSGSDPVQSKPGQSHPLHFREAIDICRLLEMVESHTIIHLNLVKVVDAALGNRGEYAFTQENLQLLLQKISELVQGRIVQRRNVPGTRQIRHEGYEVVCGIQIMRLKARCKKASNSDWDLLIDQARAIPNTADRAFVLVYLALALRADVSRRRGLFEEAKSIIVTIPTSHDRLERYQFLIDMAEVADSTLAKEYVRTAFEEVMRDTKGRRETSEHGVPPSHLYGRAQKLLDTMHGISPELATTLANEADDEPARQHLKGHLKYLERKKKFENEKHDDADIFECSVGDWARMAWSLLGQLNAGRIEPWRRAEARDYIRVAARAPLSEAYPILSWTIENLVRRHGGTEHARDSLVPLFHAALSGATIVRLVSQRTAQHLRSLRSATVLSDYQHDGDQQSSLSPQDRDEAFKYINNWIQANVKNQLSICDGYLNVDDICDLLHMVVRHQRECAVTLLVSEKALGVTIDETGQALLQRWSNLTNVDPPDTHIIIASTGAQKKSPIHDRYFLTESAGLTTGTSANGYALSVHSLASMDEQHFQTMNTRLEPFITLRQRRQGAEIIRYSIVQLPVRT